MRKILFNGSSLLNEENYGIQRNMWQLLTGLDKKVSKGKYFIVIPENGKRNISFENIGVIRAGKITDKKGSRFYWNNFVFPKEVKKHKALSVDLLLSLSLAGTDAVLICDCIREMFPENAKTLKDYLSRLSYILRTKICIRKSRAVLTISETSKNDIAHFYHVSSKKIAVIYCAWQHMNEISPDENALNKFGLSEGEYLFALGSRYSHKNTAWIINAAKQNSEYKFVISGTDAFDKKDVSGDKPENLYFTGYISDGEVKALMAGAKAFVQPSLYEGFGLPPMEAMSTGTECIIARAGAMPEIYGNTVHYIDPYNTENIDISKILGSDRDDMKSVLDKYSWDKSANRLIKVIDILERRYGR